MFPEMRSFFFFLLFNLVYNFQLSLAISLPFRIVEDTSVTYGPIRSAITFKQNAQVSVSFILYFSDFKISSLLKVLAKVTVCLGIPKNVWTNYGAEKLLGFSHAQLLETPISYSPSSIFFSAFSTSNWFFRRRWSLANETHQSVHCWVPRWSHGWDYHQ